jgi:tRNA 2-thiouridine synthesizing protein A
MVRTLDVRGLRCPLPLIRARAVVGDLRAGDALEVLATDPEAPIDLAALAADLGLRFSSVRDGDGVWRIALRAPAD